MIFFSFFFNYETDYLLPLSETALKENILDIFVILAENNMTNLHLGTLKGKIAWCVMMETLIVISTFEAFSFYTNI